MTIRELLDLIDELDLDPETPVRIAIQPGWPLRKGVAAVTHVIEGDGENAELGQLFIAATDSNRYTDPSPYAPETAWEGGRVDYTAERWEL